MSAPNVRTFTVGQVMTVLVGSVLADRVFCSWGELLDVLGWLLQDVPMADEVDGAIDECRPYVEDLYPDLATVDPPSADASDTHVLGWLADLSRRHGNLLELTPVVEVEGRDDPT